MDTSSNISSVTPRKKMDADVFVKIWSNRMIENELVGWAEWVAFDKYKGIRRALFSNIEVEGIIQIQKTEVPLIHLVLDNCYLPNCQLIAVEVRSLTIMGNSTVEGFTIENSTAGDIKIDDSTAGDFNIYQESKIGEFVTQNSTIGNFWITASISDALIIQKSTTKQLYASDSKIKALFLINSTNGLFRIYYSKVSDIYIYDKSRVANIDINHSELQTVNITSDSFIDYFKCQFNLQFPVHLLFEESTIGNLVFDKTIFSEFTTLRVSECAINLLTLREFCNYGTIFFSNLNPLDKWEKIKEDQYSLPIFKNGLPQFETIKGLPTLRLTDSDLGKIQFINCDLRQFKRFEFSNTKMLDVFVAGSQMPEEKSFHLTNDEQNPLKNAEQKRLAYGQFKKIYEARGDIAGSLPYLAYEMEAYRQQLQIEGWWKNRGELAMLWANKLSTNYGVSWQRGLGAALLSVAFFYSIFCYLIGYRFENNSPDDVERFWKLVSYAPYYLNPLRDLDSVSLVKEEDFTPWARIWDFISRIFVAYFVYQTIQAFRKLGKSSG